MNYTIAADYWFVKDGGRDAMAGSGVGFICPGINIWGVTAPPCMFAIICGCCRIRLGFGCMGAKVNI